MISITKSGKLFFISLIIVMSLAIGYKKSDLMSRKKVKIKKNNKFLNSFNNEANKNKTMIKISAENLTENYNNILKKIYGLKGKLILKDFNSSEYSLLFTIPDSLASEFSEFILDYHVLKEESFFNKQNDIEINTKQRIANNELVLKKLENQLELRNLTETSIARINKQFTRIQTQIDSLEYLAKRQKSFLHSRLFWISSIKESKNNGIVFKSIHFILYSTISMIVLFILFFILVYLVNFILKLMDKAGIKTTKTSSSTYGPKYASEKKIKRIYKNNSGDHKTD